jgi:anaerobic selenocysteine-containing dehydrogenase
LYNKSFVDQWCYGFDELREYVQGFSPSAVSEICGVEEAVIVECAQSFANSPSAIVSGRGIDQVGQNVAPTHRARCCLLAITGNVDSPGSCVLAESSDFVEELELEATLDNFDVLSDLCLNTEYTPLQCYEGYKYVDTLTTKLNRRLPARYLTSAHPDLVLQAMETGDPYPIRALIVEATNPLLTYADTNRVYNALMNLDLIVVIDYFMTSTAQIADYVLPSAGAIERPTFQAHGGVANMVYGGPAACKPYYERKTDYEIFRELGIRLGQEQYWPWETFEQACEYTLARAGMSWEEYCEVGMYFRQPQYFKHEILNDEGEPQGFATSTGKIELASVALDHLGGDRLPHFGKSAKLCDEQFIEAKTKEGYMHYQLITGGRKQPYNASMYLNNPDFRKKYPHPLVEMSANTANALNVVAGDLIELATNNGVAVFEVSIINMRDNLLHADYGWWHPEAGLDSQGLGGIWESNINTLTECSLRGGEAMIGTWSYNDIDCMAKKYEGDFLWPDAI